MQLFATNFVYVRVSRRQLSDTGGSHFLLIYLSFKIAERLFNKFRLEQDSVKGRNIASIWKRSKISTYCVSWVVKWFWNLSSNHNEIHLAFQQLSTRRNHRHILRTHLHIMTSYGDLMKLNKWGVMGVLLMLVTLLVFAVNERVNDKFVYDTIITATTNDEIDKILTVWGSYFQYFRVSVSPLTFSADQSEWAVLYLTRRKQKRKVFVGWCRHFRFRPIAGWSITQENERANFPIYTGQGQRVIIKTTHDYAMCTNNINCKALVISCKGSKYNLSFVLLMFELDNQL